MVDKAIGVELQQAISKGPERLPHNWISWVIESRLADVPPDEITDNLLKAGFAVKTVESELERLRSDPSWVAADRLMQRFKKLKSLLDVKFALGNLAYRAGTLERRSKLSGAEFLERYYATNTPVVLTGLLANSGARARWSPDYLAKICGETTVEIMSGRESDPNYAINAESHKREIKMSEYVHMVQQGGASNDYYMVSRNHFFDRPETQQLYEEVPRFPEYLDHSKGRRTVFFWFGPTGTITPLHHDQMNILIAQIRGRKRFTLISPEQTAYLYNNTGGWADVDCEQPDYSRYPLYRDVRPLRVVLQPGDVLFLPAGWWHHVKALDVSIMVSYINFKFPNQFEWGRSR